MTCGPEVALLAEGVDRNSGSAAATTDPPCVALLAEGVDRNIIVGGDHVCEMVALLAEGVDRNITGN